jgi:hypothetical protein
VFAPHSRLRAAITPAGRGAGGKGAKPDAEAPAVPKHVAMSWAQRLRRVFAIEIDTCAAEAAAGRSRSHAVKGGHGKKGLRGARRPGQPRSRADQAVAEAGVDTGRRHPSSRCAVVERSSSLDEGLLKGLAAHRLRHEPADRCKAAASGQPPNPPGIPARIAAGPSRPSRAALIACSGIPVQPRF